MNRSFSSGLKFSGTDALRGPKSWFAAVIIFMFLWMVYQVERIPFLDDRVEEKRLSSFSDTILPPATLDCYSVDDSTPNLLLACQISQNFLLTFESDEVSSMLRWSLNSWSEPSRREGVRLLAMDPMLSSMLSTGKLNIEKGFYIVVPSPADGRYANTFGVGAALTALPAVAVAGMGSIDLREETRRLRQIGKWTASACVAGSAVFLFLASAEFLSLIPAVALALVYGLCTCVYSVSSQDLWQHGPTELFLAGGVFFLPRSSCRFWISALSGVMFSLATWCRPTSVIVLGCVAIHLMLVHRKSFVGFMAAGIPMGIALMVFNTIQFGGPATFGQTELSHHALEKTGSPEIWQTSLLYGACASLLSPSRGLLIYSPFLIYSGFGISTVFNQARYAFLRPIIPAVFIIWCIEFRHFDWWGGWSFGYRHLVDTVILLTFVLIPVFDRWSFTRSVGNGQPCNNRGRVSFLSLVLVGPKIFWLLVLFSLGVQFVGTFLYDRWGWNGRLAMLVSMPGEKAPRMTFERAQADKWVQEGGTMAMTSLNIDDPRYRDRLWSICDSQLVYYVSHSREAYRSKKRQIALAKLPRRLRLSETYDRLGQAACAMGDVDHARTLFARAHEIDPRRIDAYFHFRALNPPSDGQSVVSREVDPLDGRLLNVVDLLSNGDTEEALEFVEETATVLSKDHRDSLVWALDRVAGGEFSGVPSDALKPMRDRLQQLMDWLRKVP
ncbi:tetratricopeptide repeat protein [bacterium]|nr:tetratricopeptide repeat protein [bacterium]